MCLPDTLSGALTQKVKDRTANKSERKQALLEVLGVMSVNWDKIYEIQMRKGEHQLHFQNDYWRRLKHSVAILVLLRMMSVSSLP